MFFIHQALQRHFIAYSDRDGDIITSLEPGQYHWRSGGEKHINDPTSVANLQEATRNKSQTAYDKFRESQEAVVNHTVFF